MKKIILLFSIIIITTNVFAQNTIEKSQDVVVVLGRKYYVHKVKQGETIYSLGLAYEVPQEDILLINKEIVEDLEAGSVLRIPIKDDDYVPAPINKISFTEHTVAKKESLYSIAKKYGTTQDKIIKYNPQIENGIEKGMVLKIPLKVQEAIEASDDYFTYHQIRNGDNLQIIAIQYGITVNEIKEFNDNANNLIVGEILAIPTQTLSEEQKAILKFNQNLDPNFINIDPNYFEDTDCLPCTEFAYHDTMTFKIAIALPLFININYSKSYDALANPDNAHYYDNTKIFYDYLQGTLLAINKLRKEGMNLKLFFYDTRGDSTTTAHIFNKYEMSKMDLIFGPVYSKNYDIIDDFTKKHHINVVSPLSNRASIINSNPYIYKIVPSFDNITKYTARHVILSEDTCQISVISNGTAGQIALADTFKNELILLSDNPNSLDFRKITFSKFVTPYANNLNKNKHNIVFITSTNEVEVSAILNNLNSLVTANLYRITVYAMPTISSFTKLQSEWISNLNIHYASTTHKKIDDWNIKELNQIYHRKFGSSPSTYAYTGYDATYYFVSALKQYGKYFQFCLGDNDEFMQKGVFMRFNFSRCNSHGGFENEGLFMLYYNNNLELNLQEDPPKKINEIIR